MNNQLPTYDTDSLGWFKFDWSGSKRDDPSASRDISLTEAATVFADPVSRTIRDPQRLDEPDRYVTIGTSYRGRRLVVSHTDSVESGAAEKRPDTLRVRIDDFRLPAREEELQFTTAAAGDGELPEGCDFTGGSSGRYAEHYSGANVKYIDEYERYWFNVPADTMQTCLWGLNLEKVSSGPDRPIVDLVLDNEGIRKHHHLPEDMRFILRLEDVTTVRAYHCVTHPAGWNREETMSWPEFEALINRVGMYVEDTRLARDEGAGNGVFLDMDGLTGLAPNYRVTEGLTFRIHAAAISVLRTDGVPCSLEELEEMGNAEWDAKEARALARQRPLIERIKARFRRPGVP